MIRLFLKDKSCMNIGSVLVCALLALTIHTAAQIGRQARTPTGVDDVVFAISFSPDGSTLAIARGASDPAQRYGRIELWDTKTGTLRHVIKGFDGPIKSISFSPDGRTLVSVSREYRVQKIQEKAGRRSQGFVELKWWDTQTGEFKRNFILPREETFSAQATYSPDGRQLALVQSYYSYFSVPSIFDQLGDRNRPTVAWPSRPMPPVFEAELNLLDAHSGEAILKLNTGRPGRAVFSPDGLLLAKENGKDIKIWNLQTGREERRLKDFKGEPNTIAFSPDGRSLAVAVTKYYHESEGNVINVIGSSEIQIFEVQTWEKVLQLPNVGMVNSLAFEPDGKLLVIGGLIHEQAGAVPGVKLWNLQNKTTAIFHTGGEDFGRAVDLLAISRNGGLLALRSGPDIVQVLDTQTWKVKYTFDANSDVNNERPASRFLLSLNRVMAVAFSRDGKTLTGEVEGSGIKLWDPRTGEVRKRIAEHEDAISIVEVSANGNKAAELGEDGTIRLLDLAGGDLTTLTESDATVSALGLSADGQELAVAYPNRIVVLKTATREVTRVLDTHQGNVNRVTFSADGGMLAAANEDGVITTWALAGSRLLKKIVSAGKVTAIRFAPGLRTLASASEDGTVSLWDLETGTMSSQLKKHNGAVNAIAFSDDGTLMATGGDDRTVNIWDTTSGKSRRTLKGHDLTVTSLAFSVDAALLASGGGNASVVLWDLKTGNVSRVLK
jgi:WD40 repeat protein